eukprot:1153031-Pelagomonas_calceolata.AAC.5
MFAIQQWRTGDGGHWTGAYRRARRVTGRMADNPLRIPIILVAHSFDWLVVPTAVRPGGAIFMNGLLLT